MPVETRAGGQTPASAPASRAYRSSRPPKQARFPARRVSVKTYGRKPSTRALQQQTLTQFDYFENSAAEDTDEGDPAQKRRRTTGDAPTSSFQTQTLTQFLADRGTAHDEDEDDDDLEIVGETRANSVIPQTPAKQRTAADLEIPSSQPSPFTPLLRRYPLDHPSPLKGVSVNADAPSPAPETLSKRPRSLVIHDSYSSAPMSIKSEKFRTPSGRTPLAVLQSSAENARRRLDFGAKASKSPPVYEIPDSDDELASMGPTPALSRTADVGAATHEERSKTPASRPRRGRVHDTPTGEPETPTRGGRPRTQQRAADSPRQVDDRAGISSNAPTPATSSALPQGVVSSSAVEGETPISSPPAKTPRADPAAARSQYYASQVLESQRVPLDTIRAMGPPTDRTDIILSIDPPDVVQIVDGTKTHEFCSYRVPPTVTRIWVYETKPRHELRYMAVVGGAKEPGEIDAADRGVGNESFNEGRGARFAYELEQVYELNNPVPLDVMRRNGWVEDAPEKYVYVPPAVVGHLLGNLRCALFDDGRGADDEDGRPDLSVSQELATQIRSDMEQAERTASDGPEEVIPASQDDDAPVVARRIESGGSSDFVPQSSFAVPRPPLPNSAATRFGYAGFVADKTTVPFSQATTASQPSSPEKSIPQSVPRPPLHSSEASFPEYIDDSSPLAMRAGFAGTNRSRPVSLGSSSQVRLPESLLEDVRRAPVVLDSDDDEDDEL